MFSLEYTLTKYQIGLFNFFIKKARNIHDWQLLNIDKLYSLTYL